MQALAGERIMSGDKKLLTVVADIQCISLLQAFEKQERTAFQLSLKCGIKLGTVYRKLKLLQKTGLLNACYRIRPDGKKFALYKSLVREITISLVGSKLEVGLVLEGMVQAGEPIRAGQE